MKKSEISLSIHKSMGIEYLEDIDDLDTLDEFKNTIKKTLNRRVNRGIMFLLCCRPSFIFMPLAILCVISFPFVFMVNLVLGLIVFFMFPGCIILMLIFVKIQNCLVERHQYMIKYEISKKTRRCCSANVFLNFEFDGLRQKKLNSYGNQVKIKIDKDKHKAYYLYVEEKRLKEEIKMKKNQLQKNENGIHEPILGAPGENYNLESEKNKITIEDPHYPQYPHYNQAN